MARGVSGKRGQAALSLVVEEELRTEQECVRLLYLPMLTRVVREPLLIGRNVTHSHVQVNT